MKATTPFPHDQSYDADHVNGEIFDTDKPLPEAPQALECGVSTPLSLSRPTLPKPIFARYSRN